MAKSEACTACGHKTSRGYWLKPADSSQTQWYCDPCYEDQRRREVQQMFYEDQARPRTWLRKGVEEQAQHRSRARPRRIGPR